jgi:adenosylmethionine-8-amino-7-oxononanoate aminotransferase
MEADDVCGNVRRHQDLFATLLNGLRDIPIVGDIRGAGYFRSIELVQDQGTKTTFSADECEQLLRRTLSPRLYELGLYCRADDRADPVLVLSPPLIAGEPELREIERIVRIALTEASAVFARAE